MAESYVWANVCWALVPDRCSVLGSSSVMALPVSVVLGMFWASFGCKAGGRAGGPPVPRLRRTHPGQPGITRRRRGKGWAYLDSDNSPVTDKTVRRRIDALVIPPAWQDVWITPFANGHLQAVGTDAAGRRQYLYHPDWHNSRSRQKTPAGPGAGRGP